MRMQQICDPQKGTAMKENVIPSDAANSRNRCLDFFKGMAAIFVIFVHIRFPGKFGSCISSFGSSGVMLFFLISGFHAYGTREKMLPKLMQRFRRNLLLTVTAVLVYFLIAVVLHHFGYRDLHVWIRTFLKPQFYLRMLVFSDLEVIHGDPLWFMFALLYAYLIFWVMYRLNLQRFAKFAMPLFILLRIVLESYKYAVDGDWRICSNVFVAALPLMLLGYCIAEYQEKLRRIPAWVSAAVCEVSVLCLVLLIVYDPFRYNVTQICKLLAVASVFLFAMQKPDLRMFPPVCRLGRDYSLHVYLWHMPVIVVMLAVCSMRHASQQFYDWYLPPIVAGIAIVLAILIVAIRNGVKKGSPMEQK